MEHAVYGHLGRPTRRLRVGPGRGLDNAVMEAGNGRVLIVTVDPISAVPAFGMELSAWLSVHLVASDFTASGIDPQFSVFSYNFPREMAEPERELYVASVGDECRRLGVAVAAGHTGSYPGSGYTVIGSGSMLGFASEGSYVTPSMAREGDAILVTKHAGIEATASLALSFPLFTAEKVGAAAAARAAGLARQCTTVEDARSARSAGLGSHGVTSMHDATEGGVLGALEEMACASGRGFKVDAEEIPVAPEAKAVCGAFRVDPLKTMGEGALLITCSPSRVRDLAKAMSKAKIELTEIGTVERSGGLRLKGSRKRVAPGGPDPYWAAYDRAVRRGLK